MGYRGKLRERERARALRAQGVTLADIATRLGVAKSSVSVWVRDVPFTPSKRRTGARRRPHPAHDRKVREIEECDAEGRRLIGRLSEDAFLAAGVALYAGEGAKTDGCVKLANTNPEIIRFFCAWLRRVFEVEEARLRVHLYLHQGLDLRRAQAYWSEVTGIPDSQFTKPYRAVPDGGIRHTKHVFGCATVAYGCSRTHRLIMGLIRALLSSDAIPG
jgi:hypothetical protein